MFRGGGAGGFRGRGAGAVAGAAFLDGFLGSKRASEDEGGGEEESAERGRKKVD